MATITDLAAFRTQRAPARPQAPPDATPESASFMDLAFDMGLAEGERRAYAAMGIPQPPRSRPAVLAFTGPAS